MKRMLRTLLEATLAMSLLAGCVAGPEERANALPTVEEVEETERGNVIGGNAGLAPFGAQLHH